MNRKGTFKSYREARNNWILCFSKSTNPGKSYFFNVDTGESVWKGNDFEKQKCMIQNMNARDSKFYQEPRSPPMFMPYQPYYGLTTTPPQFGHSSFRNYLPSEPSMQPNLNRWTRTPDNMWHQRTPEESLTDMQEDIPVVIKTTSIPLHERFMSNHIQYKSHVFAGVSRQRSGEEDYYVPQKKNRLERIEPNRNEYNHPVRFIRKLVKMDFGINNQEKPRTDVNQIVRLKSAQTQTEKDVVFKKTNQAKQKHEVACQFNDTDSDLNQERYNQSELEFNHEQSNQGELDHQSNQAKPLDINQHKVYRDQNVTRIGVKRSIFSPIQNIEESTRFEISNLGENSNLENSEKLEESDLRLKLLAKRKKGVDNCGNEEKPKEIIKIKTTKSETAKTPKKKVSFSMTNLKHDLETEFDQNYDNYDYEDPFPLGVSAVKNDIIPSDSDSDLFFVISDIDLLTEHWSVLEGLLKTQPKYKLLIPNSISKELDDLCKGDCRGRDNVLKGRQVKRLISLAGDKIVIEGEVLTTKLLFDPVIECCQRSLERGHTVVLLGNDKKIEKKANENQIAYFDLNDIKELMSNDQPVTFDSQFDEKSDNYHYNMSELETLILEGRQNKKNEITSPILECKSPKINKTTFQSKNIENVTIPKKNDVSTKEMHEKNSYLHEKIDVEKELQGFSIKKNHNIDEKIDIEKELKRFPIKNNEMADRLKARMEEWIFRFTENMEFALNDVLRVHPSDIYELRTESPWSLLEATTCLKRKLNQPKAKLLAATLNSLLSLFDHGGAIKGNIRLGDYMRLFGLGVLLIEALMEIPDYKEILQETLDNLMELQKNIEDPTTDVEPPHSPLRSTSANIMIEREKVKVPVDVKEYLKKNFAYLNESDDENAINEDRIQKQEKQHIKIVRTLGKNADKLLISNKNTITMDKIVDNEYDNGNTFNKNTEDDNKNGNNNNKNTNDNNKNENNDKCQETKVVRKITLMREFEDRMKETKLDLDLLDYEDDYSGTLVINENCENDMEYRENETEYRENEMEFCENDVKSENISGEKVKLSESEEDTVVLKTPDFESPSIIEKEVKENENNNNKNDNNKNGNNKNGNNKNYNNKNGNNYGNGNGDDLTDSGFEVSDESIHVQSAIIKTYLRELSLTFQHIHNFIQSSSELLKEGAITERKKIKLEKNTEFFQTRIYEVVDRLKCIIERETGHSSYSVKALLAKSNPDTGDVKLWRYRQILTKCLEQAEILRMALKMLKSVINDDYDEKHEDTDIIFNAIPYFNIFE